MFLVLKTILAIVLFSIFFIFGVYKSKEVPVIDETTRIKDSDTTEVTDKIVELKKEFEVVEKIEQPPPLEVIKKEVKIDISFLTVPGIISWTNFFRQLDGFLPLKESRDLNSVAQSKIIDMLSLQYFEHVSPNGEGAGDLAKKQGYKFVLIGENLAIGDFEDDEDMVRAWMASPGHKANILKSSYTEVGVAVKKGFFNGREVWLGVQIFATPLSFCESPEGGLLEKIESNKAQLKSAKEHLDLLQNVIEEKKYHTKEEYEKIIAEYNSLIPSYNFLSQNTKLLIEEYNQKASLFNQCVDSIS